MSICAARRRATPFVTNIDYDAKGQRELIAYGNGAQTAYEYDPLTFRLTRLLTTRPVGLNGLASSSSPIRQSCKICATPTIPRETSPASRIRCASRDFHINEPLRQCTLRLHLRCHLPADRSQGREHIGQTAHDFNPQNRRDYDFAGLADFIAHPNDLQAMRHYTERYEYDAVGNFQFMRHIANGGSWTRGYEYDAPSLIERRRRAIG